MCVVAVVVAVVVPSMNKVGAGKARALLRVKSSRLKRLGELDWKLCLDVSVGFN